MQQKTILKYIFENSICFRYAGQFKDFTAGVIRGRHDPDAAQVSAGRVAE